MKPRARSDATKLRYAQIQLRNARHLIDALRRELSERRHCGGDRIERVKDEEMYRLIFEVRK